MPGPIDDIENKKAQMDMGVMGFRVYQGALEEGATIKEAFLITCSFYVGMFKGSTKDDPDE